MLDLRAAVIEHVEQSVAAAGRGTRVLPGPVVVVQVHPSGFKDARALGAVMDDLRPVLIERLEAMKCIVPANFQGPDQDRLAQADRLGSEAALRRGVRQSEIGPCAGHGHHRAPRSAADRPAGLGTEKDLRSARAGDPDRADAVSCRRPGARPDE
jgi:hypothetical protein